MSWSAVAPQDVEGPAPSSRSKHSATLIAPYVYLLGGRNGNLPMKDFWKYNIASGKWQQLKPSGDKLPALQEHSTVAYKENIYVFGGEVGFSAGTETALWCYDTKNNSWKKIRSKKGVATPKGRRGHSALVYRGSMYIYGGYQDLRGSSSELWAFHFETESWHLLSTSPKSSGADLFPPPRHKHSAIIHDDSMWIYGGMTDLIERSDLWKWDMGAKSWNCVKSKINPGPLHGHAVCKLPSCMILFGGERGGHPTNDLWKFSFTMECWEKIQILGEKPQPRSESVAFTVSDFVLNDTKNSLEAKSVRVRARTCTSADRGSRHSSYLPNNRVAPSEKTYVFQANSTNYTDGSGDLALQHAENHSNSRSFLQEITKISQINISRLNNKCSYTVLSGCPTDSTESLLRQHSVTPPAETKEEDTPSRGTLMVKSKSAYVLKNKKYQNNDDPPTSTTITTSNSNNKKKVEFDCNIKNIPREPISVPNFAVLSLPTPVLTPVEATKLVYLDTDEENDLINDINDQDNDKLNVTRGESYSSHLAYADNPLYQHMIISNSRFENNKENVSSTSDYASIETLNRLSSASNYSVKTQDESYNSRNVRSVDNNKTTKDGPFGFCNPNYFGPPKPTMDVDNNKSNRQRNLKSSLKLHSSEEDLLELQDLTSSNKSAKVYYRSSARSNPPKFLELELEQRSYNHHHNKSRALSASRADRGNKNGRHDQEEDSFDRVLDPYVPLYVYVIGGKEQGQVTVFRRPISIWKLKMF